MKKFSTFLFLPLFLACSSEGETEMFYTISVRDTCETTTNTVYSDFFCVSKQTYERAEAIKKDPGCPEITFETLSGQTVEGIVSGLGKGEREVPCNM